MLNTFFTYTTHADTAIHVNQQICGEGGGGCGSPRRWDDFLLGQSKSFNWASRYQENVEGLFSPNLQGGNRHGRENGVQLRWTVYPTKFSHSQRAYMTFQILPRHVLFLILPTVTNQAVLPVVVVTSPKLPNPNQPVHLHSPPQPADLFEPTDFQSPLCGDRLRSINISGLCHYYHCAVVLAGCIVLYCTCTVC